MNDLDRNNRSHQVEKSCKSGCRSAVPQELATITRRREINSYVKSTALKLSEVATSNTRLSDDMKKKVLTTFLTLMNLQESVDRSRTRPLLQRTQKSVEPAGLTAALAS
jgi:hypothetical protein